MCIQEVFKQWLVNTYQVVSQLSVSGQSVVSQWSVSGQSVVSQWSVIDQLLVSQWSVSGQVVVSQWSAIGQLVISQRSVNGQLMVSQWSVMLRYSGQCLLFISLKQLKATDTRNGKTSTARVVIRLKDINDNSPVFQKTNYILSVSESRPVNFVIATIVVRREARPRVPPSLRRRHAPFNSRHALYLQARPLAIDTPFNPNSTYLTLYTNPITN